MKRWYCIISSLSFLLIVFSCSSSEQGAPEATPTDETTTTNPPTNLPNPGNSYQYSAVEKEVFTILNAYRVNDKKVKQLTLSDGISHLCANHVEYTLGIGNISHDDRAQRRAAIKALYPGSTTTAEIVSAAISYPDYKTTAQGIINGYKSSSNHNAAMINAAFTHVGISVKSVGGKAVTCLNFLEVK